MAETREQEIMRYEELKRQDGVDELIQHYCWTTLQIVVSLEDIRKGPDRLLTLMTAKINQKFSAPKAPTVKSAPAPKKGPRARTKA